MNNQNQEENNVQRFIPYSSWDNVSFWINREIFGRDFPTWEEASNYGAFQIKNDKAASNLYKKLGTALTMEQIKNA
jgi:hypothetical protein